MTKKILVIDDDSKDRRKIVTAMEGAGYTVMAVAGVEEAMKKAWQTLPDLAIVDVVMPDSDTTGFDICRRIKATFQPSPPSVLMVTGKAAGVNGSLAHMMGADGFEVKTSNMAHVVKAAQDIFSRSRP